MITPHRDKWSYSALHMPLTAAMFAVATVSNWRLSSSVCNVVSSVLTAAGSVRMRSRSPTSRSRIFCSRSCSCCASPRSLAVAGLLPDWLPAGSSWARRYSRIPSIMSIGKDSDLASALFSRARAGTVRSEAISTST